MNRPYEFALLGNNVGYSKSPDIFNAIFETEAVEGRFVTHNVETNQLQSKISELVDSGTTGFSITIPHKHAIIKHLDHIDPVAGTLGAVNSVCVDDGSLLGYNTDCVGFCVPLKQYSQPLKHSGALILGAGGAAKAVVYGLFVDFEVRHFIIAGRSATKLRAFKENLESVFERIRIDTIKLDDLMTTDISKCSIVVNCTPLAGWNHSGVSPLPNGFDFANARIYYDLNYNPDNRALALAKSSGLAVIDGSKMLVGQAIKSFDIWTGIEVPFDDVYDKVFGSAASGQK